MLKDTDNRVNSGELQAVEEAMLEAQEQVHGVLMYFNISRDIDIDLEISI